jgi:tetratricopeptide (TPR) repeat protein
MSENDADNIEPVDFDLNESTLFASQTTTVISNKPPLGIWIALAALFLVALLVIFVLPSVVTEYELPLERRVDLTDLQPAVAPVNPATAISPFEEAQRSLQRKEAQDVLAALLERQGELDALEVEQWAQADYESALEEASIGDEYYLSQDFALATESYTRGRDGLVDLLDTVSTVLTQTLIDAQQALDEADSTMAQDKFSLALLFDPENEVAQIGMERSRALDAVTALFASADELLEDGELAAARDAYQEILNLDSYNDLAKQRVADVGAQIAENEFASIMSSGYALLSNGDAEQAIATFQRAANMGINQEEAFAAITQTENEVANVQINAIRELIGAAESQEQWQAAVTEYDSVLSIDANLLFAINGRDYAGKRAQLDQLLVDAINNPERFAEDAVYQQTLDVYYTGRSIEEPGPKLVGQLDQLQAFLESSQVPIDIRLESDNLTDVTLLRVGNLGAFEQHALSLKPGRYVAVGRRGGYREVREEFTVGFGLTPASVVVRCEERIAVTSRR